MKSVAGTLKLNLAQYREMAAFAQFGSDLDKATQEQLANGERQTEMLKQPQYQPMPMELQVISIFAATPPADRESWVRQLPLSDIQRYENEMLEFVQQNHADVVEAIRKEGKLDDAIKGKLRSALDDFARVFQPTKAADAA
jgi:F-type H+-transporting ATPase subunit alpha